MDKGRIQVMNLQKRRSYVYQTVEGEKIEACMFVTFDVLQACNNPKSSFSVDSFSPATSPAGDVVSKS